MDLHAQKVRSRAGATLVVMLGTLAFSQWAPATAQEMMPAAKAGKSLRSNPREPFAAVASLSRAALFLDESAVNWTRQHQCGSCHTNYPYLLARPVLKEPASSAMAEVRRFFEERVAHWDDARKDAKPRWDAEVVSTAAALAFNDAATTGSLHPLTKKALDRVWALQKPSGGFDWLKCGWPPLEHDDYYGTLVAALGAGHAPGGYAQTPSAQTGLTRLRSYFAKNPPPDLHHQTILLWASSRLEGLMSPEERSATINRLRKLERPDGGWNLPSLGTWKRRDGKPNIPDSPSDGYGTGLVLYVLRASGVPASDPALRRAVGWLLANQRASGAWFTRSLNNDKDHYISHAGAAFAVLGLHACGISGGENWASQPGRLDDARRAIGPKKVERGLSTVPSIGTSGFPMIGD
jgi:squalene-hopene/tetraprenyl-beta-curcumene cyclase